MDGCGDSEIENGSPTLSAGAESSPIQTPRLATLILALAHPLSTFSHAVLSAGQSRFCECGADMRPLHRTYG